MKANFKNNNNNNRNDDDYIYDIDFEKYVDNIVNSDDENDKKIKINVIITEKEFFDKDHIHNSFPNNNTRIIYNKGNIYTNPNYVNKNYVNKKYVNKIIKKVNFNDNVKIIDDCNTNTFRENSPKSIVNLNEFNDDVRNKKFNDFIPKGKYVFPHK
jgi:hypothetical protein